MQYSRYGFNGKEKDEEFSDNYDFEFRIYNSKIAKFLSVDPLVKKFPGLTPYQFANNTPIWAIDFEGLESWYTNDTKQNEANFGATDNNGSGFTESHRAGPISETEAQESGLVSGSEQTTTLKIGIQHGSRPSGSFSDRMATLMNTGGKSGGHVLLIMGESAFGFTNELPGDQGNHLFSHREGNWNSHFHETESDAILNPENRMTSIFTTKVSLDQYNSLYTTYKSYSDKYESARNTFVNDMSKPFPPGKYAPYDYAVTGKRCASSCIYQLTKVGVLNSSYTFSLRVHSMNPGSLIKYLKNKAENGNEWTYEKKEPSEKENINTNFWDK